MTDPGTQAMSMIVNSENTKALRKATAFLPVSDRNARKTRHRARVQLQRSARSNASACYADN
jgi:hypothetical protein